MAAGPIQERNQGKPYVRMTAFVATFLFRLKLDATVYVGGLDEKVSETVLWELFLQAGPVG